MSRQEQVIQSMFLSKSLEEIRDRESRQTERDEQVQQLIALFSEILSKSPEFELEQYRVSNSGTVETVEHKKRVTPRLPCADPLSDEEIDVQLREVLDDRGNVSGYDAIYFKPQGGERIGTTSAIHVIMKDAIDGKKNKVFGSTRIEMSNLTLIGAVDFVTDIRDAFFSDSESQTSLPIDHT